LTINSPNHQKTLGRKLLILVVLFSSVITLFISAIQLNSDYKRDIGSIHSTIQSIKDVHLESLTSKVWTADLVEIQNQLDGILRLPDIQYIEILEESKVIASTGDQEFDNIINQSIQLSFIHRGEELNIGTLNLQATKNTAKEHLIDQAITIVISNGIKTFLVSALILYLFHHLFTRHLHTISAFTQQLSLNNLDQHLKLERKPSEEKKQDELDILVQGIRSMQQNLSASIAQAKEKDAHYRQLVESSTAIPWELDLKTWCFTYVGPQAKKIFGYPIKSWYQKDFWGNHLHPEDKEYAMQYCITSTEAGEDHSFEYRMITAEDKTIWIRDDVQIIMEGGKAIKLQGYMFDITQRKLAEIELGNYRETLESTVKERTKELQNSNQELEAFCYSVSHDLRAPLRAISGFAQILLTDKIDNLDEESVEYLERVISGGKNMGELIDALLDLSRVTRHAFITTDVNLSELFKNAIDREQEESKDRFVDVTIEPDLIVNGDKALLNILINNLANNAWKYTSKTSHASITFGSTFKENQRQYFVSDNGTGFDQNYSSKLFSPFQRLHTEREFEGTGIGLATVQRIVNRHNGNVWASGKVDNGARFSFTLNEE